MTTNIIITYEVNSVCPACGENSTGSKIDGGIVEGELIVEMHCKLCGAVSRIKPDRVRTTPARSTTIQ